MAKKLKASSFCGCALMAAAKPPLASRVIEPALTAKVLNVPIRPNVPADRPFVVSQITNGTETVVKRFLPKAVPPFNC